jgi:hypothetical protein
VLSYTLSSVIFFRALKFMKKMSTTPSAMTAVATMAAMAGALRTLGLVADEGGRIAVADAQLFTRGAPQRPAFPRKEVPLNLCREPFHGMGPERLLKDTLKEERDLMLPSDEGIAPDSLFIETSSTSRFNKLPRLWGISPDRSFAAKSSDFSCVKLPKDSEMLPDRWL